MTAYYNEIDPYAAQHLRNLIAAGHIAPGVVDERSIEDVPPPNTLHSSHSVISSLVLGCGATLYALRDGRIVDQFGQPRALASLSARQAKGLGLMMSGICGHISTGSSNSAALSDCLANRLQAKTQALGSTLYNLTWKQWTTPSGVCRFRLRASGRRTFASGRTGWPTPTTRDYRGGLCRGPYPERNLEHGHAGRGGPVNGFWADAQWVDCKDDRKRPIEPGTFPLANGVTGRVGRLRAYGNALNAQAAKEFIKIAMEFLP